MARLRQIIKEELQEAGRYGDDPMTRDVRGWDRGAPRRGYRGADVMGTAKHPPPEEHLRKKAFHEIAKLIRHRLPLPWRVEKGDPIPSMEDIIKAVMDDPSRGLEKGTYMPYEKKRFLSVFNENDRERIVNKVIKDYYGEELLNRLERQELDIEAEEVELDEDIFREE